MKKIFFLIIGMVTGLQLQGAEINQPPEASSIICVPGLGSGEDDGRDMISYVPAVVGNAFRYVSVSTPGWPNADLAQERCVNLVRKKLRENPQTKGIVYAVSQGAATAINYVAQEDQGKQVQALILEAPFASGNSAIAHTGNNFVPILPKIPFFRYWAPYAAKLLFPWYSSSGQQPIKSMQNLPKQVPIIFAHSKLDPQVDYHDSCALYYAARKNGNDAYLISKEEKGHAGILWQNDQKAVQAMLKKHKLMPGEPDPSVDLTQYQPDPEQFRDMHDRLLRRERKHTYVSYGIKVGMLAGAVAALKYFVLPAAQTLWNKKSGPAADA